MIVLTDDSRPTSILTRAEDWFFDPCPQHHLVIARIVIGGMLFLFYISLYSNIEFHFGPESLGSAVSNSGVEWLEGLRQSVWWIYFGLLISSLGFTVGFKTRFAGLICWSGHTLFLQWNPYLYWGWGNMCNVFLIYLILSRCGDFFSLDHFVNRKKGESINESCLGVAWPTRLIQIQIAVIYFVASFKRLPSEAWWHGELVYEALVHGSLFARFPDLPVHSLKPLLQLISYGTFFLEMLAPILLWPRKTRTFICLMLMALHFGLEVMTTVGYWQIVMLGMLPCFLPNNWLRKLF